MMDVVKNRRVLRLNFELLPRDPYEKAGIEERRIFFVAFTSISFGFQLKRKIAVLFIPLKNLKAKLNIFNVSSNTCLADLHQSTKTT